MTFNETKDYLNQNISVIKNLTPSFRDAETALSLIFKKIEYAMQHEDSEGITPKEFRLIDQFFSHYIRGLILLNFKFTDEIANVSRELSLLIDNFSNIYVEEGSFDPTGLIIRTLVQVDESLQSQLYLNTYLVGKLQEIISYKQDPLDERLSRKYYEEYVDFLNRRKDHDSSYSIKEN